MEAKLKTHYDLHVSQTFGHGFTANISRLILPFRKPNEPHELYELNELNELYELYELVIPYSLPLVPVV